MFIFLLILLLQTCSPYHRCNHTTKKHRKWLAIQ